MYTGESFEVTDLHFAELRAMAIARIRRPSRYQLLLQSGDEVLDYRKAIDCCAGAWQYVEGGGDHAFSGFDAQIPAILRFCALQRDRRRAAAAAIRQAKASEVASSCAVHLAGDLAPGLCLPA